MSRAQQEPVPESADATARLGGGEVPGRSGEETGPRTSRVGARGRGERRLALPALVPSTSSENGKSERGPAPEVARRASPGEIGLDDLGRITTRRGLVELLRRKNVRLRSVAQTLRYEEDLEKLQVELVKMQRWIQEKGRRVAVLFEGRDAAGKGGAIRRFTEHLNPRAMRVVALPVPTEQERGQWYFQRYSRQLPNAGEIVFFDRSWYNRAVVEPVNRFCTEEQYQRFMQQVPEYEHMLYEDGVTIVKFWFSITKEEQLRRFESRKTNALKQWKLSPIDNQAQDRWAVYTRYKEEMLGRTHTSFSPWIIVRANDKKQARIESIRYLLSLLPYAGKESAAVDLAPDPSIVSRYHRAAANQD